MTDFRVLATGNWTFDEYVSHVNLHAPLQDEQRLGQYAFNLLCRIRPSAWVDS